MVGNSYRFERRSRRAALASVAGAALGLAGVGLVQGDFWMAVAGALLPLPLLAASRFRPSPAGAAIEDGRLTWWVAGATPDGVALAEIAQAVASSEGIHLRLADGSGRVVPAAALPDLPAAMAALDARGVATASSA